MAETQSARSPGEQSLGDLVALALRDISRLIKWEIDLAKLELRADLRRVAVTGLLLGMAAFVGCLVIVLVSFAAAYALIAQGWWAWLAFLSVAGSWVVLATIAVGIGMIVIRRFTGMRRTVKSVQADVALLRGNGDRAHATSAGLVGSHDRTG